MAHRSFAKLMGHLYVNLYAEQLCRVSEYSARFSPHRHPPGFEAP
jgi:hypothetical protein